MAAIWAYFVNFLKEALNNPHPSEWVKFLAAAQYSIASLGACRESLGSFCWFVCPPIKTKAGITRLPSISG